LSGGNCPLEIQDSTPDFPCNCPFSAGTYHLNATTFTIPALEGIWKILGRVSFDDELVLLTV